MAKKMTVNQKAYAREISRIKGQITRLKNLGYVVSSEDILPPKPSRVTKTAINALKNIRIDEIAKNAYYQSYQTGELVSYADIRRFFMDSGLPLNSPASEYDLHYLSELPSTSEQPYVTFDIIERLKSMVENLPNEKWYSYGHSVDTGSVKNWAFGLLGGQIKRATLDYIIENWERISNAVEIIQYGSKQGVINTAIYQFTDLLADAFKAANVEILDIDDSETEAFLDYYENWQDF